MPPRILVLDDEELFAEYLVIMLRRAGYDADSVRPGRGVETRLSDAHSSKPVDLLISDLFMPKPDGFEILRFARKHLDGVPVIGMSGKGGALLHGMLSLGASRIFTKPFEGPPMIAAIRDILCSAPGSATRPPSPVMDS